MSEKAVQDVIQETKTESTEAWTELADLLQEQLGEQLDEQANRMNLVLGGIMNRLANLEKAVQKLAPAPVIGYMGMPVQYPGQPQVKKVTKQAAKPVMDLETGVVYPSKSAAGKELAHLVGGDPGNSYVWYDVLRAFPARFQEI